MKYLLLVLVVATCFAASMQSSYKCKCEVVYFKSYDPEVEHSKTILSIPYFSQYAGKFMPPSCAEEHQHTCAERCVTDYKSYLWMRRDLDNKPMTSFNQSMNYYGARVSYGEFTCVNLVRFRKVPATHVYFGMFSYLRGCAKKSTYAGYYFNDILNCDARGNY